ncbi:MAG: hypothetical protein ABW185_01180 [Sedimenticola sp.]
MELPVWSRVQTGSVPFKEARTITELAEICYRRTILIKWVTIQRVLGPVSIAVRLSVNIPIFAAIDSEPW